MNRRRKNGKKEWMCDMCNQWFEVGGCYEDWGFVIEQNGRTISSGRTLKEAISKLKDSK